MFWTVSAHFTCYIRASHHLCRCHQKQQYFMLHVKFPIITSWWSILYFWGWECVSLIFALSTVWDGKCIELLTSRNWVGDMEISEVFLGSRPETKKGPLVTTFFACAIIFFLKRFYLFIHERHTHRERMRERERGRDTGRERSRLHAGARCGTRSQDPGITTWAKGRCSTTEPPRCSGTKGFKVKPELMLEPGLCISVSLYRWFAF